MDYARKVALVPQQLLSTLMAQQQFNPALGQLNNMDYKMQNVLQSSDLPSDIKHKQYNQMMHQYQAMKDHELSKPLSVDVKSMSEDDIITGMPKPFRNKAKLLLNHVKRAPNIDIDESGHVVINGQKIQDSNITDLIFEFSKPVRRGEPPTGWRQFGQALRETNVPREAIVNRVRWNQLNQPVMAVQEPRTPPPHLGPLADEFQSPSTSRKRCKVETPKSPIRRSYRKTKEREIFSPYPGKSSWRSYKQV